MADTGLAAELLGVIARLNRWATHHADLEIPPAQARLLAQIDASGAARIGDLARADHSSQPTMTTQVQRLEEFGWVSRAPDPTDARAVLISLSADGAAVLQRVRAARGEALAPLFMRIDDEEQRRVRAAVDTLARLLETAAAADET